MGWALSHWARTRRPQPSREREASIQNEAIRCAHLFFSFNPFAQASLANSLNEKTRLSSGFILGWRRERDSNPRYRFQYDSLANCSFRPLRHLSVLRLQTYYKKTNFGNLAHQKTFLSSIIPSCPWLAFLF